MDDMPSKLVCLVRCQISFEGMSSIRQAQDGFRGAKRREIPTEQQLSRSRKIVVPSFIDFIVIRVIIGDDANSGTSLPVRLLASFQLKFGAYGRPGS